MKHAVSRELYSYWDGLRQGRSAPERADIDPAAIRNVLSDTFVLNGETGGRSAPFTVRLSGTRLNALFLREMKGASLLDLWLEADQPAVGRIFHTVLDDAAPLVAGLRGAPMGHRPVDLEMVLLPLRHHGRTHARILGAIAPVEMPPWLGLVGIEHLTLTSVRLIEATPATPADRRRAAPPPIATVDGPRRYGRFLVHEGGR